MKRLIVLATALLLVHTHSLAQGFYWHKVASGTTKKLTSISFGNGQVGYISGTSGLLLRSTDGGLTWGSLAYSGLVLSLASPDIIHVNFLSAATGYAVVGNAANPVYTGSLYRTNDSGKTWQAINAGNIAIARTFFFDANNGFCIGSAFFAGQTIVKQTSATWGPEKQFSYDPSRFLYGIDFRNAAVGIVGGDSGYVYRTFNGGASWDTVKTVVDSTINSLKFLSDRTILAGTNNDGCGVLISNDTGRTWQFEMYTLTFAYPDIKGIVASKRDSFIAVGHASLASAGVILWHDSGHVYNEMTTQRLNDVAMRDDSTAYAVGDSGLILTKRRPPLRIGGPGGNTEHIQVYPNPAPGYCTVEATYLHTIRMFDALGRLVLQEDKPAKKHSLVLGHLSRGVYILEALGEQRSAFYQRIIVE
jgi:photosystem II stability/assembly factor-like uncharacterized protein